jgi:hypothetical protein
MQRSTVEGKLHRYQGVKKNMHCLLLNNGLENTMKILDYKLQKSVREDFQIKKFFFRNTNNFYEANVNYFTPK